MPGRTEYGGIDIPPGGGPRIPGCGGKKFPGGIIPGGGRIPIIAAILGSPAGKGRGGAPAIGWRPMPGCGLHPGGGGGMECCCEGGCEISGLGGLTGRRSALPNPGSIDSSSSSPFCWCVSTMPMASATCFPRVNLSCSVSPGRCLVQNRAEQSAEPEVRTCPKGCQSRVQTMPS